MTLDGLKISNLIMPKAQSLFEVFDHLFNLPAFGVIFNDIQGREMEIGGNKIGVLLSFFFHDHYRYFAQTLDDPNKSGDLEGFVFAIDEGRDLSIS